MHKYIFLPLFLYALACCSTPALAQSGDEAPSIWTRENATGSWNGLRLKLEDHGLGVDVNLITEVMGNIAGGIKQEAVFIENLDFKVLMDTEKLIGWSGSNILLSTLQNNGQSISAHAGDVQGISNIEAVKTIRLFEAWIQQNLFKNKLSILGGLYDINSEFDFMESASLFIQSSQGLGGDFAGSGLIGPPTFPIAGLGGRIKYVPNRKIYLQAGIFDGVPGAPGEIDHADFSWNKRGGSLVMAELGLLSFGDNTFKPQQGLTTRQQRSHVGREVSSDYQSKIAFGAWNYSRNYVSERYGLSRPGITDNQNDQGIYILADWKWNPNPQKPYQQLSIFGRIGFAENEVSRFKSYGGGGITFKGILPGDPNGLMGLSIASVQDSKLFQRINPGIDDFETAIEWTYLSKVVPWLNVQPDLQYIISPGTAPNRENVWILGLRTDIIL
ncbi:carbohydrate porin [Fodinibius saliphilus]|uniref:carbohydrate porin n=1 Tax=Fodinibius saliphilus TaxID=1920650 RepID=UPI001109866D|nr:carbohydrate porin [Fodinibius saliphilus]